MKGSKSTEMTTAVLEAAYQRLREQVRSENDLYNQRIIWLITMQALLFATMGLVLQAKFADSAASAITLINAVFALLAATGIVVALISNEILQSAVNKLNELGTQWDKCVEVSALTPVEELQFPHVKGRNRKADHMFLRSGNLPKVFMIAWGVFLLLLLVAG